MAKVEKRGRKNDKRENGEEVDQRAAPSADISNHFRCYFNHHPPDDGLVIGAQVNGRYSERGDDIITGRAALGCVAEINTKDTKVTKEESPSITLCPWCPLPPEWGLW
jgi:hypothetical protein